MPLMKTLKLGNVTYQIPIGGGGSGMSSDAIAALLNCFSHVAWIDGNGQQYYDALYDALTDETPATLLSISAVFNQGSAVVYDIDDLDSLRQYLTVTAHYDDSTTGAVTNYTLSGTLTEGTSTITVSYGGKIATFTVTVTDAGNAIYILRSPFVSTGTEKIDTGVKFESGNTYTILGEFVATADTARASFLFTNKIVGNNTYCGLHLQKQNETYPRYMWGAGIPYGNGENKYVLDTIIRFAVVVEVDLAKCTMYLRNTSAAQTRNFTNTYTVPAFVNDTAIYLGNETGGNGFNGTVNKFVIESGSKPISEINAFLEESV